MHFPRSDRWCDLCAHKESANTTFPLNIPIPFSTKIWYITAWMRSGCRPRCTEILTPPERCRRFTRVTARRSMLTRTRTPQLPVFRRPLTTHWNGTKTPFTGMCWFIYDEELIGCRAGFKRKRTFDAFDLALFYKIFFLMFCECNAFINMQTQFISFL